MRPIHFLFFALSILINAHTFAQNTSINAKKAKVYYESKDYYNAIGAYQTVVKKEPKILIAWYELGNSYYFSRNHIGAISAYEKLAKLIGNNRQLKNEYYMTYLRWGQSLIALEQYNEAKKVLLSFLKLPSKSEEFRSQKRIANNRIKSCDQALELHEKSHEQEFTVSTMSDVINSGYSDFAPIWFDSTTLIFTSLNKNELVKKKASDTFPINHQLYTSRLNDDQWSTPEKYEDFSHEIYHTANGSYSRNRKKFAFSRCQENKQGELRCEVFISNYQKGQWSTPEKMKSSINRKGYTSTQAAFGIYHRRGKDTEVLYFVSDRPGGRGQLDIWYTVNEGKNIWSEPINCGGAINTSGNEITPYYHGETTELYFSSDFHYGLGGYDVFKAYGGLKSYRKPENLGVPLNSSYDDTYFSWRYYLAQGTLVSNRKGSKSVFLENCCDDIYLFDFQSAHIIEGHLIADDLTKKEVEGVELGLADLAHLEYIDSVNWIGQTDKEGNFKLKFKQGEDAYLVVAKEGYETHYIQVSKLIGHDTTHNIRLIKDLKWAEKSHDLTEDKLKILSEKTLNNKVLKGDIFVMEHIYFDFDQANIKPESYQDLILLRQFLKDNINKKIEIAGHTDNLGTSEHNHQLSQQRAEAISNYLISKGVAPERLVAIGYGEDAPITDNEFADGSDNPEGRKLNRRIEVKILN